MANCASRRVTGLRCSAAPPPRLLSPHALQCLHAPSQTAVPGPPVECVVLATGYCYAFPFLDEATVGLRFRGERSTSKNVNLFGC